MIPSCTPKAKDKRLNAHVYASVLKVWPGADLVMVRMPTLSEYERSGVHARPCRFSQVQRSKLNMNSKMA